MREKLPIGIVAIGRNEGERLKRCLKSCVNIADVVVFVDSGSNDGSCEFAESLEVEVVSLDTSIPFSAARARNEGFARLVQVKPEIKYVQFVDGDCEFVEGWLKAASDELDAHPNVAIVCGRLVEKNPEASIYNRLCQIEWDGESGEIDACGGIFMVRSSVYDAVGGFNPQVIAAEDDEFCVRVRLAGHKLHRIDHEMAFHDANMTRFSQWWKRMARSGHAYAQVNDIHGDGPYRYFHREVRSILMLGVIVPLIIFIMALFTHGWGALAVLGYFVLIWRVFRYMRSKSYSRFDAWLFSASCIMGKFPQVLGLVKYRWNKFRDRQSEIIEYKGTATL